MVSFAHLIRELERTGHRRLVVLMGDEPWTLSQATALRDALPGDWLWLNENPSKAIGGLLGREYLHAVFDAHAGLASPHSPRSAERCAPGASSYCEYHRSLAGPTGQTAILCAGVTAQSRSLPRTLFTIFAGRLPPIRMRSSGNSIIP